MNKKKLYGTLIAVIFFAVIVIGATFAWLTYSFNATNGVYNTATVCFDISSAEGQDINATLDYTTNPIGGVNTSIAMGLQSSCVISANGTISINVASTTSATLYSTSEAHCENPNTLETLYNYETSSSCETNNGTWVTTGTALKYAIYDISNPTSNTTPIKVGYINQSGDNLLYETTLKIGATDTYYIYFWLDGELIDENYMNVLFSGHVHANATQNGEYINPPEVLSGLIPVKLSASGDTVTTVATTDPEWYDYDNKKWANAVLVKDTGVKTRTQNSVVGTVIDELDILAYYVWIPRYSYQVWAYSGSDSEGSPHEIPIKFVSTAVKDMAQANGQWYTHPAFTFGDTELSGIWVGKFETHHTDYPADTASSLGCTSSSCDILTTNKLRILPNVRTLTNNSVSSFFFASRTIEKSGNAFGINASTIDTHMMKNSEWGAVAYLSHSKYGINDEIRINNTYNYDDNGTTITYLTGCGADTPNKAAAATCDIQYGEVSSGVYPQSTTGNITGIFDMAGGTNEFVMGTYNSDNNYSNTYSGFNSGTNPLPDSKYYDNYTFIPITTCTLATCGGHALYETKSWYNDSSNFLQLSRPWLFRGGMYNSSNSGAGVFSIGSFKGDGNEISFRIVLTTE